LKQLCVQETETYGELCVIICHVLRGSKKQFLKTAAGRAKGKNIRGKIGNIGYPEISAAKAAVQIDVALTPVSIQSDAVPQNVVCNYR